MINLEKILVLDIETVPQSPDFKGVPENLREHWNDKCQYLGRNHHDKTPEELYDRAGIYAEFGKIVCISTGFFRKRPTTGYTFRVTSFCSDNEQELLEKFCDLLNNHFNTRDFSLCAHNGREFDFPYIARRMIINNLELPALLNISGNKPWETESQLLDTMHMWRFGDYKNFTSLSLLACILGIESPKDDIKGSDVHRVYWQEKNLPRIVEYCQKDVVTVAQLLLRFNRLPLMKEEDIITV